MRGYRLVPHQPTPRTHHPRPQHRHLRLIHPYEPSRVARVVTVAGVARVPGMAGVPGVARVALMRGFGDLTTVTVTVAFVTARPDVPAVCSAVRVFAVVLTMVARVIATDPGAVLVWRVVTCGHCVALRILVVRGVCGPRAFVGFVRQVSSSVEFQSSLSTFIPP